MEFATSKEAESASESLRSAGVRLNYANLTGENGVRVKVVDREFEAFRKWYKPPLKENVSDLISKFKTVTVSSGHPVSPPGRPLIRIRDEMDAGAKTTGEKYSIGVDDVSQMTGQLVRVLEAMDDACKTCLTEKGVQHLHYILQEKLLMDPVLDAPPAMQQLSCSLCQADGKLMKCSGCDHTSYCSRSCQVKDWLRHKRLCKLANSPAPSSPSLNYSAQMSPNGSLEPITGPLTNVSGKLPAQYGGGGGGDRIGVKMSPRQADPAPVREQEPAPVIKQADVADGTTPFRQTVVTRTRIEDLSPSGARSPAKASPGQLMKEMLTQPLSGTLAEPPEKRAQSPQAEAVVAKKEKAPLRKLKLDWQEHGLIVWQDEADPDIFYVSGDEKTIYKGIIPKIEQGKVQPGFVPKVGAYVLARSTDDEELYRAQVTGIRGEDVAVHFIDYGNNDNVNVKDVRPMPSSIDPVTSVYPPQAVRITAEDQATKKAIKQAFDTATDFSFVPVKRNDNCYVVRALSA